MPVICSLFLLSSYSYETVSSEMFVRCLVLEDVRLFLPLFTRPSGTLSLGRFSSKAPAVFTGELQVLDMCSAAFLPGWSQMLALQKCRYMHLTARGAVAHPSTDWRPNLECSQVSSPPALSSPWGFGCTFIIWLPGIKKPGRLLPAALKQLPPAEWSALCQNE